MPNLANAKKALRQSDKRSARNQILKDEIHSLRRHFRKAVSAKNFDEATKMLPMMQKKLDKLVTKNIFKKNKSSRIKSRLVSALKRAQSK